MKLFEIRNTAHTTDMRVKNQLANLAKAYQLEHIDTPHPVLDDFYQRYHQIHDNYRSDERGRMRQLQQLEDEIIQAAHTARGLLQA